MELRTYGGGMEEIRRTLGIQVAVGGEADPEDVAEATLQLRRDLLDLDVESVELPSVGEPPAGTKAAGVESVGALIVTVAQSPLLVSVVSAILSWLTNSRQRSIRLELGGDALELTGTSSDEQRRLTDEWLRRHQSG